MTPLKKEGVVPCTGMGKLNESETRGGGVGESWAERASPRNISVDPVQMETTMNAVQMLALRSAGKESTSGLRLAAEPK